ncbi:MAG: hypothetical protein AB7K09_26065 [Planctomycetota bacterium]
MATFVLGATRRKGCSVCGKDIFRLGGGAALILEGSNGRIAVCSRACADTYDPANDPYYEQDMKKAAEEAPAEKPKKEKKEKKRKPKLK